MSDWKNLMKRDMELRGFSPRTRYAYLNHVRFFQEFFNRPLESMGETEIKEFLHYAITVKNVSSSYVNTTYSALRFLYETTMRRNWEILHIPRAKKEKILPIALSATEIDRIFEVTSCLKHKAILMTIYGAGLRVGEATQLKISDIDSYNMQIHIRQGKGKLDRYSLLSQANLEILRRYYREYQPKIWLFPGNLPGEPIRSRAIQDAFYKAREKAGVTKKASVHSLRHSFATHLLEAGVHIVHIQQLLGHSDIKTTSRYLHLVRMEVLKIKSPLDSLKKGGDKDE